MHYINASHPVGYFDRAEFQEDTFQFAANDRLLLYTDGLVDCNNPNGEMFGAERLDEAFARLDGDYMVFLERLFDEVDEYLAGQPPFDDCTALVIDFPHNMLKGKM